MKRKINILAALFILLANFLIAQPGDFRYRRKIGNIDSQWHKIILPDSIYDKMSDGLNDLRIYGFANGKDTFEAPYILRENADQVSVDSKEFQLINESREGNRFFYTFELDSLESINKIEVHFKESNFNLDVRLEGSNELSSWYEVIDGYRILSIQNSLTKYNFTTLNIPSSKYRYYRLSFESENDPGFRNASILNTSEVKGDRRTWSYSSFIINNDDAKNATSIYLNLAHPIRINQIKINIPDRFDYFRPISINYLTDSVKTDLGWRKMYSCLTSGTLNSLNKNTFSFESTTVSSLKLNIQNGDNQVLNFSSIELSGYSYSLKARFTNEAEYFLYYGSERAKTPEYDISHFTDKIPKEVENASLAQEEEVLKLSDDEPRVLFGNKLWLWIIMSVLILSLGWFSINMMRKA